MYALLYHKENHGIYLLIHVFKWENYLETYSISWNTSLYTSHSQESETHDGFIWPNL